MTSMRVTLLLSATATFWGGLACSDDGQSPVGSADAGAHEPDAALTSTSGQDGSSPATTDDASSPIPDGDAATSTDASLPDDAAQTLPDANAASNDASSESGTSSDVTSVVLDASPNTSTDASLDQDAYVEPAEFAPPRGPCATADRIGRFIIESQKDFGVVQGTVSDSVVPTSVPEVAEDDGTCRLDKRRTLICLPACESGETCGEDGECIAYPARLDVGELEITGLTRETHLSPQNPGFIYVGTGTPNPPYTAGSEIILTATGGGEIPRFDLFGIGSTPLSQEPSWVIDQGQDLELSWPSAGADPATTVLVELTIDQHGTSPLSLSCEFPDTGNASVPSELIDQMLSAGVSGFPNGRITRRTADHVDVALGCIELAVGSPRSAQVTVTGYTPCNNNEDCPDGQTCNIPIQQCE